MLEKLYIPRWSGDFRLEEIDATSSKLSVVDPTVSEREQLRALHGILAGVERNQPAVVADFAV